MQHNISIVSFAKSQLNITLGVSHLNKLISLYIYSSLYKNAVSVSLEFSLKKPRKLKKLLRLVHLAVLDERKDPMLKKWLKEFIFYSFQWKNSYYIILRRQLMFPNQQLSSYFPQSYGLHSFNHSMLLTPDIFEQINNALIIMNQNQQNLMNEVQKLKQQMQKMTSSTVDALGSMLSQQCSKHMQRIKSRCEQNCFLKKDQLCPVKGCQRKYSSKIALRAHLRKNHSKWDIQNKKHIS